MTNMLSTLKHNGQLNGRSLNPVSKKNHLLRYLANLLSMSQQIKLVIYKTTAAEAALRR